MVIKCDLLARLVTSRARRGTFARRSEHLDCPRTRRRTDAHTRSIFFSRAHVAVHDQKHTFCENVRMLYVSKFTFQLSSMMTVPYAHTQAPSKSATVPRSNRPTRAAPPEAPCRPTCLGSPSCTLKPELPDDMGMRRCGGAHPADRAFIELVVCLAFPFMTSSVRLSFAAAHFSCGRISCSQSDQSGKPFFLQAKKHPLGSLTYHEQCDGALPKPFAFFAFLRLEDPGGPRRQGDVKRLSP